MYKYIHVINKHIYYNAKNSNADVVLRIATPDEQILLLLHILNF